ncbi:MAG: DNA polymerase III subunit beta [Patescibacteria group bacterium]
MKCEIIADNLKKALSFLERSTGKDSTLPILGSFLFSCDKTSITITGTNLEIGMKTKIRGTVQEVGSIAIPSRTLLSYINTIQKDEKIVIETSGVDIKITIGSVKTIIKGFSYEDFPPFPEVQHSYIFSINNTSLLQMLTKTLISVSKSTIKPELASIYITIEQNNAIFVSTDSFRLSEERVVITSSIKNKQESFLLPLRTGEELVRFLEYTEEQVEFFIGNGELLIKSGDSVLYSRLTEGKFPDYKSIIPQQFKINIIISRDDFLEHIRRASLFTNKLNGILLTFIPDDNLCKIESSNRDVGEYKADMPVEITGDGLSVVFNYHYLLDGVLSLPDKKIFLGLNSESQPLLIRPPTNEQSIYIVMPMKGVV